MQKLVLSLWLLTMVLGALAAQPPLDPEKARIVIFHPGLGASLGNYSFVINKDSGLDIFAATDCAIFDVWPGPTLIRLPLSGFLRSWAAPNVQYIDSLGVDLVKGQQIYIAFTDFVVGAMFLVPEEDAKSKIVNLKEKYLDVTATGRAQ